MLVNRQYQDVWKKPVTDSGKDSKRGRLQLYRDKKTGEITTGRETSGAEVVYDVLLETYYENGEILIDEHFDEIRARAV